MQQYDTLVKHLMDSFAPDFAAFTLGISEVEVIEKLPTEQPTFKTHHTDVTLKIRVENTDAILHIEAQTDESRSKPMPLRVLAYSSFLLLQHELPVYSIVLYFRPPAGQNDPGGYSYTLGEDFGIEIKYKVIRLYALEGEQILEVEAIGLLPFAPLMRSPVGISAEAWVQRCVEAVQGVSVDETMRATLLLGMSIFGSLVHPSALFTKLIMEETMQMSPFYQELRQRHLQEGIEQGIERGARETTIENILSVLAARFPQSDVNAVKTDLEGIESLERLKALNLTASLTSSFEGFLEALAL